MIDWEYIALVSLVGLFCIMVIQIIHMIYDNIEYLNKKERKREALKVYNRRELEFVHDEMKWNKWKEQNSNICKIIGADTYY